MALGVKCRHRVSDISTDVTTFKFTVLLAILMPHEDIFRKIHRHYIHRNLEAAYRLTSLEPGPAHAVTGLITLA